MEHDNGGPDYRIGLVGCGMIALEHIRNLGVLRRRGLRLKVVALCDCMESAMDAAEGECEAEGLESERRRYSSLEDLVEEEKDELDCVILCTPNYQHHDQLVLILRATWWAVLSEKPLCTTVSDCLAVVHDDHARMGRWTAGAGKGSAQALRHGGAFLPIVWVGMEYRYMAPVAEVLNRVQRGDCGKVWHATLSESRFPFLSKAAEWNKHAANSGQTIVEKSCHYLDLFRQFKKGVRPVRVAAFAGMDVNFKGEKFNGKECDIWDAAMVLIEFEDGARAFHQLCMYGEGSQDQEQLCLIGDKAKIEVRIPEAVVRYGTREGGMDGVQESKIGVDEEALAAGTHFGSVYYELVRFLEAVAGRRAVEVTTEDGAWAVALGVAATLAATERRVVDVDAVLPRGLLPSERGLGSGTGAAISPPVLVDYTPAGVSGVVGGLEAGADRAAASSASCDSATSGEAVAAAGGGGGGSCDAIVSSTARHSGLESRALAAAKSATALAFRAKAASAGISLPGKSCGPATGGAGWYVGMAGLAKL